MAGNLSRIHRLRKFLLISRYDGIIHLDPLDTVIRDGIKTLAIKSEELLPGVEDNKLGLCNIITEVFYIIQ